MRLVNAIKTAIFANADVSLSSRRVRHTQRRSQLSVGVSLQIL